MTRTPTPPVVYAESISDAQAFTAAAKRFTAKKPLIIYKAGRFAASAKAAVSHTGAMAGADEVYNAAFERVGATRVLRISDLYHSIELLSADRTAHQPTLAIVTNAGGPGVMSVDALSERGGRLAEISPTTLDALNEVLPTAWSHANPIDVLGDAPAKRYEAAINAAVTEEDADGILVILTPQAMTDISASADAVIAAAQTTDKPVLAVWMGGGEENAKATAKLIAAGIPTFEFPENAVDAFVNATTSQSHADLAGSPTAAPADDFTPDRERAATLIASVPETGLLPETESKELFDAYGIPVALPKLATSADEAAALADQMGYPIVAKIASPDITHKTDVGGVVVGPKDAEEVREAYQRIVANAKAAKPDARIEGVVIEQMVAAGNAELILGSTRDPSFGQTIMVAAGGTSAEILKDSALQLAPVDAALARRMVESLRIWPLIKGYRGAEGADVDALVKVITRFSTLVAEHPEITETEMNPLTVSPSGAIALDARAVIDREALVNPPAKYSHLGILPQ
ncbi:MAG: acetate--CoA ligase family protein [Acidipropionibacterium sp.]|jgi:acetyltransferase|nr:acetate--CoA ligase family protein [Acidipropionibacterium sp.]